LDEEFAMEFKGFRVLEAAILFARLVKGLKLESASLRKQLTRAADSTALLLAEGEGRETWPDKLRFFTSARGSHREAQVALRLGLVQDPAVLKVADYLGAGIYKLTKWRA
jgi:four helix bundle protein